MKPSKDQSDWMKKPVEESTSWERGKLKRKEDAMAGFASAMAAWRESTEEVQRTRAASRRLPVCTSTRPSRTSLWQRRVRPA